MNTKELPIIQEISKEKKNRSEKEMLEKYTPLKEEDIKNFVADIKSLNLGFDVEFILKNINDYILECEKEKRPVYENPQSPYTMIWRTDFYKYFKRFQEDKMASFKNILDKIFIENGFTSREKTIPPKEKLTPAKNTPQNPPVPEPPEWIKRIHQKD